MRLFQKRGTGCGLLVLVLLLLLAGWLFWGAYPFLARHAPVVSDLLVIEGWLDDDVLEQAVGWAASNGVEQIYLTGGPIAVGSYLVAWNSLPEMTKARMEALDLGGQFDLQAVPADKVRRGRTRASARALKAELNLERGAFNLASEGPHTRRSWRTFQQVFGDGVAVGSVALTPTAYNHHDWWSCSEGVRNMIGEAIAYVVELF
ncbi:MAG: cytosine deaminase [Kiritimatiellae bacterium]|jgi:hypothetical protein|nr:cytosine deaminase [Kiritimatiellia bacterium]MDD4341484.1 cytosine deaminase [Kiritimatiellia bacterium]